MDICKEWTFDNEKIRNFFQKVSFTDAKCRICNEIVQHTRFLTNFPQHVKSHENIVELETYESNLGSTYIRFSLQPHTSIINRYCTLCHKLLDSLQEYEHHLHNDDIFHSKASFYTNWIWKYCKIEKQDSEAECYICNDNIPILFMWSNLMSHIRNKHVDLLPVIIQNFDDRDIQEHFSKLSFTTAMCRHCKKTFAYTNEYKEIFFKHIEQNHNNIVQREQQSNISPSIWKYVRVSDTKHQCVLCSEILENETNWSNHVKMHERNWNNFCFLSHFISNFYVPWQWKYCIQINDYEVQCSCCQCKIPTVFLWRDLMDHIQKDHIDVLTEVTLNFKDEEIAENFQKLTLTVAQCKTCFYRGIHTDVEKFSEHMQIHHMEVYKYNEDHNKLYGEEIWKYIRFHPTSDSQCVLCKKRLKLQNSPMVNHTHQNDDYTKVSRLYDTSQWKHGEITQNTDFKIKCYYCPSEILIDFHRNNLKEHISQCRPLVQINLNIDRLGHRCSGTNKQEQPDPLALRPTYIKIQSNFTNFTSNTAKCIKCKEAIIHSNFDQVIAHLRNPQMAAHKWLDYDRIIEFETYIIQKQPLWKYIKLRKDSFYECVLCNDKIVNLDKELSRHTHEDDDYTSRGKSYEKWQLKYCEIRINMSNIMCGICEEHIKFSYRSIELTNHINFCNPNKNKKRIKNMKILWENCRRISYEEVYCKTCKSPLSYIDYKASVKYFCEHIENEHKHILEFEAKNQFNKSCRNLQQFQDSYNCTICQQKIPDTVLLNHECKEDYNVAKAELLRYKYKKENYIATEREVIYYKYSVRMGDFLLKCAVCSFTFPNLFLESHVIPHIEICQEEKGKTWERYNQTGTGIWRYFEKQSNARAICKFCEPTFDEFPFKYLYIKKSLFLTHVKNKHSEIFKFETKKQGLKKWKYVKYYAGINSCVFCNRVVHSDEFDIHIHENDLPPHVSVDYEDWPWKYCVTFDNLSVRCDICREEIRIAYDFSYMTQHLKEMHPASCISLQQNVDDNVIAGIQQQEVGIEGTAGASFLGGPLFLTGTQQQEESIENAARSSSLATQQQAEVIADNIQQEKGIEGATDPSFLGGTGLFLIDTQQQEDIESAVHSLSLSAQELTKIDAAIASIQQEKSIEGATGPSFLAGTQQEEGIEGATGPSFLSGPLFLTGTQQEESIKSAARSSFLAAQQQDLDIDVIAGIQQQDVDIDVIAGSQHQESGIKDIVDFLFLASTQHQEVGTEDTADSLFLAGTQQQEEDIAFADRPSSLVAHQQEDADMSETLAKQRKID